MSSKRKRSLALLQLLKRYPNGMIRHEIAQPLGIPLSSVCSLVHAMLARGEVVETGDTRESPFGQQARVLTLPAVRSER